jgi:pimeloyl-ACP methyl ester carboxylesterase
MKPLVIAESIAIIAMLAFSHTALAQTTEKAKPVMDKAKAQELFDQAKIRYGAYEHEHGGWIQTKNVRMHYLQWKNPTGTPLIWAIGTYSSAYEMAPFAEQLVKAGYRIVAIDYYGHGQTPIPKHDVSIYHVADDMAALMDSLGIDKAVIGGWSRGGAIAASFYDSHPSRTLGLILVDGGSFSVLKVYDRLTDEQLQARLASAKTGPSIFERSYPTEFDAFYDLIKEDAAPDPTDTTYGLGLLARLSQGEDKQWMFCRGLNKWLMEDSSVNLVNALRRPSTTTLFEWSTEALDPKIVFRNLDVPMLILDPVSANDQFLATDDNRELKQMFPNLVTHQIYENTSHAAHLQRPAWFVRDATALLQQVNQHNRR